MTTDALGRQQRVYHERTRDDDARAELGERGVTFGDLYAYAWNARRGGYDVLKLYAHAANRVTRYLVCERPNERMRERSAPRRPLRTSQRNASRTIGTASLWNVTTGALADVAHTARLRAFQCMGVGI